MFPSETTILMAVAVSKDTGKELLTRPMDVMGEYIGYLYDSLVSRGYLSGNRSRGYHLYEVGANLGRVCIPRENSWQVCGDRSPLTSGGNG
ncbi:hypothetical protein ES703_84137 [subsurface metagenome]